MSTGVYCSTVRLDSNDITFQSIPELALSDGEIPVLVICDDISVTSQYSQYLGNYSKLTPLEGKCDLV